MYNIMIRLNPTVAHTTSSGAVACQVLDVLFRGKVRMSGVKWDAQADYQYVANYKILQSAFKKVGIDKVVPVQKLVRGKYQDNLEFMQWLKAFFDANNGPEKAEEYDPVARRARGKGSVPRGSPKKSTASGTRLSGSRAQLRASPKSTRTSSSSKTRRTSGAAAAAAEADKALAMENAKLKQENAELKEKVKSLNQDNMALKDEASKTLATAAVQSEMEQTLEGLERERDFYFQKLRDIEILLQGVNDELKGKAKMLSDEIFRVLYDKDDDGNKTADAETEKDAEPEAAPAGVIMDDEEDDGPAEGEVEPPATGGADDEGEFY